jgi:hypothetical protein
MDASSNQVGMSKFKFSQGDSLPTACDLNITAPHHLYENKPVDVLPAVAPPTLAQLASFSSNRDGRLFQDAAAAAATVAGPPKSDSVGTASRMHRHVISSSTVAREDSDMETISPDTSNETRAAKLQDWADFLHDVDLDTSDDDT